jgi:hypothetical protein
MKNIFNSKLAINLLNTFNQIYYEVFIYKIYFKFKNFLINLYNTNKEILKFILLIIIISNFIFFFLFFNIKMLLFIYNEIFINIIDNIFYLFKEILINLLIKIYENLYELKIYIIKKYFSIFDYNYAKVRLKNNYGLDRNDTKFNRNFKEIKNILYKNIFYYYFNMFYNLEYYKTFDPKMYGLDFIYSYQRKGLCGRLIRDDLREYLPDSRYMKSRKYFTKIREYYNYIYTTKHVKREKALYIYNDLYLKRNFFILNNANFFFSNEMLHYDHDAESSELDDMSCKADKFLINKISQFNFRRKDPKKPIIDFENFDQFDNETIINYENTIDLNNKSLNIVKESKEKIEDFKYKIFMKELRKINYYDSLLKIGILEKDFDNFYLTGTTEIYYSDNTKYHLIRIMGLSDYFFFFIYYSFIKIPFFFEDFNINLGDNFNIFNLFYSIIKELLKFNNIYILFMFSYSLYIFLRFLILNELDLLYALIFFKRHFTILIIIGFMIKFNLDVLDPLSFELFLLIWIPGVINYIVYEEWWWVWWTNFEKVKYHYTFNYEGVLYCPINLYILYMITPFYFQTFLLFKLLTLYYLIFHLNRIDFKWKYIFKKNFFFYLILLNTFLFYNLFFFKEELNLLKTRFKINKFYILNSIFFINFNIYSRNFIVNLNKNILFSLFNTLKKYIQTIIFYSYMFFFICMIFLMFAKNLHNCFLILQIYFLENYLEFLKKIENNSNLLLYIKNNLDIALFKEYKSNQSYNYNIYSRIYEYNNIYGFKNRLYFKFHYPGLIFYRTSRQYNGNLYWLYFQGGNNFLGEKYYKATILNNFYKKNSLYFYKFFILDRRSHKYWNNECKFKYNRILSIDKNRYKITLRKLNRIIPKNSFRFGVYLNKSYIQPLNYNFISSKDFKVVSLFYKNFYKNTTFYTNNKTYFFSLYTYKYYRKNYPLAMDDLNINVFIRKMYLHARAWGKYHMASNFLFVYTKLLNKKVIGNFILESMILDSKNSFVPFKESIINKNLNKIYFYNKYIPNRLDYIKFHSEFYSQVYSLFEIELEQCILEKKINHKKILDTNKDDSISIFTLIFNYSEYIKLKTEKDIATVLSIKARLPFPHESVHKKKSEYI